MRKSMFEMTPDELQGHLVTSGELRYIKTIDGEVPDLTGYARDLYNIGNFKSLEVMYQDQGMIDKSGWDHGDEYGTDYFMIRADNLANAFNVARFMRADPTGDQCGCSHDCCGCKNYAKAALVEMREYSSKIAGYTLYVFEFTQDWSRNI